MVLLPRPRSCADWPDLLAAHCEATSQGRRNGEALLAATTFVTHGRRRPAWLPALQRQRALSSFWAPHGGRAFPLYGKSAHHILGAKSRYPGSSATATDSLCRPCVRVVGSTPQIPSPLLHASPQTAFLAASPSPPGPPPPLFAPSCCLTLLPPSAHKPAPQPPSPPTQPSAPFSGPMFTVIFPSSPLPPTPSGSHFNPPSSSHPFSPSLSHRPAPASRPRPHPRL